MAFCTNCGAEQQGTKFCPECGAPQGVGVAADTATPAAVEEHRPPQMDEDEVTLWEGTSNNMTSAASGGRLTSCRYRLTNKALYFDEGLISTKSQQVPLWAVRDIDVRQGLVQKARGVGTVLVHVEHSDYTGRNVVEVRDVEGPLTVRDHLNKHANKERREYDQRRRTQWYGRGQ